ncbi:unnamed protein product [Leptosia nina]|uniref:Uncharacterized protein n=1 Tax=Leptosia nina TaxID=320188 RepID=A0AAV1JV98_9NEOP
MRLFPSDSGPVPTRTAAGLNPLLGNPKLAKKLRILKQLPDTSPFARTVSFVNLSFDVRLDKKNYTFIAVARHITICIWQVLNPSCGTTSHAQNLQFHQ